MAHKCVFDIFSLRKGRLFGKLKKSWQSPVEPQPGQTLRTKSTMETKETKRKCSALLMAEVMTHVLEYNCMHIPYILLNYLGI